jgi:hypothetical protein
MLDGRDLIKKATIALNDAKLLTYPITIDIDIDSAQDEILEGIINKFLDAVETIPTTKENIIPQCVISAYNNIIDKAVTFELVNNSEETVDNFDFDSIVFRRTKFNA